MEIEINDTPATNDDLVQVKSDHPARRHTVNCRIRATAASPTSSTVVLTNPDGRLRFTGPGDRTQTVTVPGDGSWVSFQVSGEVGSRALRDAVIEAHCNTSTGALKATKPMTVFWFDEAHITLTAGGDYSIVATARGPRYTSTAGNAISMSASARIKPDGVDCTAPQITNLRIGIAQNVRAGLRTTVIFGPPAITWFHVTPSRATVTVPAVIRSLTNRPVLANDSEAHVAPLYDQPGHPGSTLDANSLNPPLGCAHGAASTSHDTPSNPANLPAVTVPAIDAAGVAVGAVTYPFQSTRVDNSFLTWCVLFDTATNDVTALKENTWELHAESTAAHQHPTAGTERDPTVDPVLTGSFSNDIVGDPANTTSGPIPGGATVNFTKP